MTMIEETPEDPRVREEEDAAAAEAGSIGGRRPEYEASSERRLSSRARPVGQIARWSRHHASAFKS